MNNNKNNIIGKILIIGKLFHLSYNIGVNNVLSWQNCSSF